MLCEVRRWLSADGDTYLRLRRLWQRGMQLAVAWALLAFGNSVAFAICQARSTIIITIIIIIIVILISSTVIMTVTIIVSTTHTVFFV